MKIKTTLNAESPAEHRQHVFVKEVKTKDTSGNEVIIEAPDETISLAELEYQKERYTRDRASLKLTLTDIDLRIAEIKKYNKANRKRK